MRQVLRVFLLLFGSLYMWYSLEQGSQVMQFVACLSTGAVFADVSLSLLWKQKEKDNL